MMEMIRRIVVRDEFAVGRENGVKVTAALEIGLMSGLGSSLICS